MVFKGIGLHNGEYVVEQYGGAMSIEVEEGTLFVLNLMLPVRQETGETGV